VHKKGYAIFYGLIKMFYCSYNVRCVYDMASIIEMVILKFMLEEIELSYCLLSSVQIVNNKTIRLM